MSTRHPVFLPRETIERVAFLDPVVWTPYLKKLHEDGPA